MVSFGLEAEQKEVGCDRALLPQCPDAEPSLWQSRGLQTVDLDWWDELGLGMRAAVPLQWHPTFDHMMLFTGGTGPLV